MSGAYITDKDNITLKYLLSVSIHTRTLLVPLYKLISLVALSASFYSLINNTEFSLEEPHSASRSTHVSSESQQKERSKQFYQGRIVG
jgi:hypothetical protein